MKVPTYHKFGLTKAGIEKSEQRDKKISDILTHKLTIGIGLIFGVMIYILNYSKVQPSNFIQVIMQVFLFASMGVICVGVPAVLFKLTEILYFKYISPRSKHKQLIKEYQEERDEFDFWKIRKDYSFWRVLDGLSFEKEVINVYLYLGYSVKQEQVSDENPNDRVLEFEGKVYYVSFNTGKEITETEKIDSVVNLMKGKNYHSVIIFSQKGFNNKIIQYASDKNIELYDINKIIRLVRTIGVKSSKSP